MPATAALGPVCTLVIAALQASSAVTALVPAARITDELAQPPVYPSILVESQGELEFNTMGPATGARFGSEVHVGVRALSQYRSDSQINQILSAVRGALDGLELTVSGYPSPEIMTWLGTAPIFKTSVSGVTTRECVAEYEITVHQGS